jgi:hypothetical protein
LRKGNGHTEKRTSRANPELVKQIDSTKKNCIYWIGTEDGFMGMLGFCFFAGGLGFGNYVQEENRENLVMEEESSHRIGVQVFCHEDGQWSRLDAHSHSQSWFPNLQLVPQQLLLEYDGGLVSS